MNKIKKTTASTLFEDISSGIGGAAAGIGAGVAAAEFGLSGAEIGTAAALGAGAVGAIGKRIGKQAAEQLVALIAEYKKVGMKGLETESLQKLKSLMAILKSKDPQAHAQIQSQHFSTPKNYQEGAESYASYMAHIIRRANKIQTRRNYAMEIAKRAAENPPR
jgi:hypothetical protein